MIIEPTRLRRSCKLCVRLKGVSKAPSLLLTSPGLGRLPRTEDGIRHLHATRLYQHRRRARRRGRRFVPEEVSACSVRAKIRRDQSNAVRSGFKRGPGACGQPRHGSPTHLLRISAYLQRTSYLTRVTALLRGKGHVLPSGRLGTAAGTTSPRALSTRDGGAWCDAQ